MDFNYTELLKKINNDFENKHVSMLNKGLKDNRFALDLFDLPLIVNDELTIGGCPRELTFASLGYPVSDCSLYEIEKRQKNNHILVSSIRKFYDGLADKLNNKKYEIYSTIDLDEDCLIDFGSGKLIFFHHNCCVVNKKGEHTMFLHMLVDSDKQFREPSDMIVMKLLPGIIHTFKENDFIKEVVVILKHSHSFEEKAITFNVSDYLDTQVLVIDGQPTSFDINKYSDLIIDTIKHINKYVSENKLSPVKNTRCCSGCLHKQFCETFM